MNCDYCGKKLPTSPVRFCPHCGKPDPVRRVLSKKREGLSGARIFAATILVLVLIAFFLLAALFIAVGISEGDPSMLAASILLWVNPFVGVAFGLGAVVGSIKTVFKNIGIILCLIAGLVLAVLLLVFTFTSLASGRLTGLNTLVLGVIALSVILIAFGIRKKKKALIVVPSLIIAAFTLMYIGVLNDQPYFIRQIQGEDFVGIWFTYAWVVLSITFAVEIVFMIVYSKSKMNAAKEKIYSDSDLMLLQGFDRYKLVGYYLLKAKLHNIIKYTSSTSENTDNAMLVEINPDIPKCELESYCQANPQVNKIVSFIEAREREGNDVQTSVTDVVYNVNPQPEIQSPGGKFASDCMKKAKKFANIIFWIGIAVTYYLNTTKLMMGIYNEKDVAFLFSTSFFPLGVMAVAGLYCLAIAIRRWFVDRPLIRNVVKFKSAHFPNINLMFENTEFSSENMSSEEVARLLRAYALYEYSKTDYLIPKDTQYSTAIFSAVLAAQAAAAAAAAASSGSGCSSCSSCSGCGGGCGGCGGCGN